MRCVAREPWKRLVYCSEKRYLGRRYYDDFVVLFRERAKWPMGYIAQTQEKEPVVLHGERAKRGVETIA